MGAVLVINVSGVETRVALVENGTISEYYLERKKDKGIVGNIYKGRVVRVLPGMQAAFVDIGLEKAAFLYVNDVFYDPDFSEQQFELTEGEHAEFDDDLDEGLELSATGSEVSATAAPATEAPAQLTIVAPALLGTPGDLKTPSALNGSIPPSESCAAEPPPAPEEKGEAGAGMIEALPATGAGDPQAQIAGEPGDAEPLPTGNARGSAATLPDAGEPEVTSSQDSPAGREASGDSGVLDASPLTDATPRTEGRATDKEGVAATSTATEAAVGPEEDEAQGDPSERRGELRARSRRRRRGGSARRELRHGESSAPGRDERASEESAALPPVAAPETAPEEARPDVQGAAASSQNPDLQPLPCAEPASIAEAAVGSSGDDHQGAAPEASPVATEAAASSGEAGPGQADADPEEPTPAAEPREPEAEKAPPLEQERTPVAEPRGNGRHHGRYGDRGRRGNRAERGAAEAKSGERGGDDAAERGDAEGGRGVKRRPTANIQDLLKVGQEIIVQVAKDPIGTKGARVTSHISIPGRQIVFMPTVDHVGISRRIEKESERRRLREIVERIRLPGTGFIVRTVAENISTEKLEADARFLIGIWSEVVAKKDKIGAPALLHPDLDLTLRATRDLFVQDVEKLVIDDRAEWERISRFVAAQAPALKERVVLHEGDEPIFDAYGIEHELQRAYSRKVWLKSGGYLIIDQAEALTAIDVNSGRYVGKKSLEETITRINIEAAKEIVYQLRLRNIGGIMIIDFIDMAKAQNRDKVFKALQEALGRDKARTNILKISELGLIEMTRKRVRESLGRTLNEPCSYCDGRGHVKSKQTMAYEIFREIRRGANNFKEGAIVVNCHPDVARILQVEERDELRYLMDRFNKTIVVRPQQSYHQEQFEIYGKSERQQRARAEREQRDSERRAEREQRQAEQGSLRLTADRSPLRKPGDPQPDRKPAPQPLAEPQGRLAEYPPEKTGGQQ